MTLLGMVGDSSFEYRLNFPTKPTFLNLCMTTKPTFLNLCMKLWIPFELSHGWKVTNWKVVNRRNCYHKLLATSYINLKDHVMCEFFLSNFSIKISFNFQMELTTTLNHHWKINHYLKSFLSQNMLEQNYQRTCSKFVEPFIQIRTSFLTWFFSSYR